MHHKWNYTLSILQQKSHDHLLSKYTIWNRFKYIFQIIILRPLYLKVFVVTAQILIICYLLANLDWICITAKLDPFARITLRIHNPSPFPPPPQTEIQLWLRETKNLLLLAFINHGWSQCNFVFSRLTIVKKKWIFLQLIII